MVNEEWKQEFVKTGYALVSANVQQGTYPPDKSYGAIRWLARSDPARKAYKEARDTLKNARNREANAHRSSVVGYLSRGFGCCDLYALARSGTATGLVNYK